jgi:hypothetical protein
LRLPLPVGEDGGEGDSASLMDISGRQSKL